MSTKQIVRDLLQKLPEELILAAVRKQKSFERAGARWHLELQRHEGEWKLSDTD